MSEEIPSKMSETKKSSSINPPEEYTVLKYSDIKETMDAYFSDKDYESNTFYKKGYSATVSEDYDKIDLLCNLVELVYNQISANPDMSPESKKTFKDLTKGITLLNKSLKQYDTGDSKLFVAELSGYILKLIRNNFHD